MGTANKSKRDSNTCVLDAPLDYVEEKIKNYPIDNDDIKEDLKKIINLPIENEYI